MHAPYFVWAAAITCPCESSVVIPRTVGVGNGVAGACDGAAETRTVGTDVGTVVGATVGVAEGSGVGGAVVAVADGSGVAVTTTCTVSERQAEKTTAQTNPAMISPARRGSLMADMIRGPRSA
jgi:hypothetical protein